MAEAAGEGLAVSDELAPESRDPRAAGLRNVHEAEARVVAPLDLRPDLAPPALAGEQGLRQPLDRSRLHAAPRGAGSGAGLRPLRDKEISVSRLRRPGERL